MHENCSDAHPHPRPWTDQAPVPVADTCHGPAGRRRIPQTPPDYGSICTLTVQGLTVVQLHGEIDLATAGLVTAHLDQVTGSGRPRIVVDLRQVGFVDAGGLDPLVRARRRALRRGGELALLCTDPRILRTLRLAGLLPGFPLAMTLPRPSVD